MCNPNWTADGKELLFLGPAQANLVSVSVNAAGATLHPGAPAELFIAGQARLGHDRPYAQFSVSADGKRFLIRPRWTLPKTTAPSLSS